MRPPFIVNIILVTLVTVATGYYAFASVQIQGLAPRSFKAEEVICRRYPVHLVNPANIRGRDEAEILRRWSYAEFRARVALLSYLWAAVVLALSWQAWHRRNSR